MASESKRRKTAENADNNTSNSSVETGTVYLDYNATTPLAPSVREIIAETLTTGWGNPSSSYCSGLKAKEIVDDARQNIMKMINAKSPDEVTFMSGGTEANNHVIWNAIQWFKEWKKKNNPTNTKKLEKGKPHIITAVIEHDSILCPLKRLEAEGVADVSYVSVSTELLYIDPKDILNEVRDTTVLVTIMMANNETGVIQHVKELCEQVKTLNASRGTDQPTILLHTDAAQTIGKVNVDVQELGVDYLTIVGHKFYGPRIGALWVKQGSPFQTMMLGGGQEKGRRAGTENTCMIAGLGEAAKLVHQNLSKYSSHFKEIRDYLHQRLSETFGDNKLAFNCFCSYNNLPNTLNVSFVGWSFRGREILKNCKQTEASVGAACHTHTGDKPSSILLAHHVPFEQAASAVRLSVGRNTCKEDIDAVVLDFKQAIEVLLQNYKD